jgi:hypothetical protein
MFPYLIPCDFYLRENLEYKVYKTKTHILEEIRNMCNEISKISKGKTPQS